MAENYDLIFGQSASQQYAWSDSDYQNGWQTVGSTPPTAEQFDALQRRSDTKAQDLNNRLSPIEEKSEADGRQAATTYTAGAMVTVDGLPNGWLLQCIAPGISGTDAITLPDTLIDGLTIIDGDVTWALRKVATNGGLGYRQPSTAYTAGQIAYHASLPTGYYLECTTAGTTSAGDITPSSTIGGTVSDGTVTWTVRDSTAYFRTNNNDISSFIDLDSLTKEGIYNFYIAAGSAMSQNYAVSGTIEVFTKPDDNHIYQIAHPYGGGAFGVDFIRIYDGATWHDWQQQESIVAKSLSSNGYIKYASGLIIQWGVGLIAGSNSLAITYPVSFKGIPYPVVSGTEPTMVFDAVTKTGFTLKNKGLASQYTASFSWITIGY